MNKSNEVLVLEIKTILHVVQGLTADKEDWTEDMPREEISYFLHMARDRLDVLSYKLQYLEQLH